MIFFEVHLIRFYSCMYLLRECPDNITFDDLGCLCWDHDGGHGDTGITMTSAALTSARSSDSGSGSGSGNCCCPIKLSSPRTSCGCLIPTGLRWERVSHMWGLEMGAGPGNPSLPHPQTPDSGAKTGSFSDCQANWYLHLQELGQRHSPYAICC